jgi:hypothetical protein
MVRLLMVPALAAPIMAASLAFAGPATAGAVVCTGLTGNASGTPPPQVTGCNDTANTGGTGTSTGALAPPHATLSWASAGGGTTTIKFTDKIVKKEKCGAGSSEATIKGKVTGHTGSGSSVSGAVKATVCIDGSGNLSLLHGTTFKL